MRHMIVVSLITATLIAAPTASEAQAGRSISIGIAAGAAIPVGDLADTHNSGYNGTVTLGFSSWASPVGFRLDGAYNRFLRRDDVSPRAAGDFEVLAGSANITFDLPGQGIRPYLIGGAGYYGMKDVTADDRVNKFGLNGGIGAEFPLGGLNTFVEARLHNVFAESGQGSVRFIPVTFGISF